MSRIQRDGIQVVLGFVTGSLQQVKMIPKVVVLPLPKQRAKNLAGILVEPNDNDWTVLTLKIETIPFHTATGQKELYERFEVGFRSSD
jgi:hypothetical protein